MTDTAFYDRMAELAEKLVNKFGTSATLRRVEVGAPGADGKAVKTNIDNPGLAVQTSEKSMIDRLNVTTDKAYIFKGPKVPESGDLLIHAAETRKVDAVAVIAPEGSRIMLVIVATSTP